MSSAEQVPVLNISEALLARSEKKFEIKNDTQKKDNVFRPSGVKGLIKDLASDEDKDKDATDSDSGETVVSSESSETLQTDESEELGLEWLGDEAETSSEQESDSQETAELTSGELQEEIITGEEDKSEKPQGIQQAQGAVPEGESLSDNSTMTESPDDLLTSADNVKEKIKVLDQLISEFSSESMDLERELNEAVSSAVSRLASELVGCKIDDHPSIITEKIKSLTEKIVDAKNSIHVYLSEKDYELTSEELKDIQGNISFATDRELERGEIYIRTKTLELFDDISSRKIVEES